MKTFKELADYVEQKIKNNPNIFHYLDTITSKTYNEAFNKIKDEYCMTFYIPEKEVLRLFDLLDLDIETVKEIFNKDLGLPKTAFMYGNPYYHILLTLYYVFKKLGKQKYALQTLFLILIRIWNGRKYKYIKYCNKDIIDYVIHYKLSRRNLVTKYKTPLDLITKYFVITIDKKYGPYVLNDYKKIKLLFAQCFARLDQIFNTPGKGGLANIYYNVYETGEALKSTHQSEDDYSLQTYETKTTKIQQIINTAVSNIILMKPMYDISIINYINQKTKVSKKSIELIAHELHNPKYKEDLYELLLLIFTHLDISNITDICKHQNKFFNILDSKILSSKHNKDVEEIKQKLMEVTDKILQSTVNKSLTEFSAKIALMRTVLYLIGYNLLRTLCVIEGS